MRILLIALGAATVVLGIILAAEHLWWIAVPEALFGIAVAIAAFESLREERQARFASANESPILRIPERKLPPAA